jgi:TM2 domain-containing membrane protein YozV
VNHRRTKIVGLILTGVGFGILGFTLNDVSAPDWRSSADRSDRLWAGFSFLAGGNLFALGLILLVAGLNETRFEAGSRARRGLFVKLLGANMILVACLGLSFQERLQAQESWGLAFVTLLGMIAVIRFGVLFLRTGWKYDTLTADQARARDPRPPVIYLRSFHQDDELLPVAGGRLRRIWQSIAPFVIQYTAVAGPEQELAMILHRLGPVIAIGKPGERLPELGAARLYVGNDRWRSTVDDLLKEAGLVLIRAGTTPSLWWEIEETMKLVPRERILIVSLLDDAASAQFDRALVERYGPATRLEAPPSPTWLQVLKRLSRQRSIPWRIVFFGDDGRPRDVPIGFTRTWSGFFLRALRPYRDFLFTAMRRVFAAQARPWLTPRTHSSAVLMALFGGVVGLHQFYLGNRRRGWRCVMFCWIGVPIVLGCIDAVRLALIDRREFDRRYPGPAFSRPV